MLFLSFPPLPILSPTCSSGIFQQIPFHDLRADAQQYPSALAFCLMDQP